MTGRKKAAIWIGVAIATAITVAVVTVRRARFPQVNNITGAVLSQANDSRKQHPVANAEIVVRSGSVSSQGKSDFAGFFRLNLRPSIDSGEPVSFSLRHPNYEPLNVTRPAENKIHIVRMQPLARETVANREDLTVADVRVRYAVKSITTVNVGSAVKTFDAVNSGNTACDGKSACSPDRKWKAVVVAASIDAGEGHQFRNARVSCIAGPCPFTKVESERLSRDNRIFNVSVRNWSDTATFLLEAEVIRTMASDMIRHSYPVIFGDSMNWTLPSTAQGPSIETEIDGSEIVFPLGPSLKLSWASCTVKEDRDETKSYRCDLKPGYRFK